MSYQITIPKPCSEDWNQMTTTQKGAFCKSCAKEVIDFSHSTKRELSRKIETGENICGRFKPEQLKTPLPKVSQTQFRRNAAMLGFTSLIALGTPLVAQQTAPLIRELPQDFVLGRIAHQPIKSPEKTPFTLNGSVTDANNLPIARANILLKGSAVVVKTNSDREFSITIPVSSSNEKQIVSISYIGFDTREIVIEENQSPVTIKLEEDFRIMGEIAIEQFPIQKTDTIQKLKKVF